MTSCRMIIVDPSTSKRAKRIPDAAWASQRDRIERLWLVEDRPMQELVRIMSQDHDFMASEPQYRMKFREWRLWKNASARVKGNNASEDHKNMQQGGLSTQTPTFSHQAPGIAQDSNESSGPAGNQKTALRSPIYLESSSSSQLHVVSPAEMGTARSSLGFGGTLDDVTLPTIEDEAWKQFEKDMIGCGHMEVMDLDADASVPSHSVSTSALQGTVDFKSAAVTADLKGGSGSPMFEAPLPSMLTSLAHDAAIATLNATRSPKTAGTEIPWGFPATHAVSSSVVQSKLRIPIPDPIPEQEPRDLGNPFEDVDFDELVLQLSGTSPPARDQGLPFARSDRQDLGATSETGARKDNDHVHGDAPNLQAFDFETDQAASPRAELPAISPWSASSCSPDLLLMPRAEKIRGLR